MPRNYKRKTTRVDTPPDVMERAARKFVDEKKSLRDVAKDFEVNFMTLQRYCKKPRTEGKIASVGYTSPRADFTKKQEDLLVAYILKAAKIYHGLIPSDIRSLAYDYAKVNEIKCPDFWPANECAGVDWF
ncbi:transposable element-derived 1-like [Octopus vulgaris]|uniref:Transposable element-derived 1-like n=1 Tax=Octopus vulgaris TaxID=6645 RepID=A0AA36AXX1_OCTVU|nr:transposable element-derived 1-like [Octopus vulgaris]